MFLEAKTGAVATASAKFAWLQAFCTSGLLQIRPGQENGLLQHLLFCECYVDSRTASESPGTFDRAEGVWVLCHQFMLLIRCELDHSAIFIQYILC